jgi:hypothetical protein
MSRTKIKVKKKISLGVLGGQNFVFQKSRHFDNKTKILALRKRKRRMREKETEKERKREREREVEKEK